MMIAVRDCLGNVKVKRRSPFERAFDTRSALWSQRDISIPAPGNMSLSLDPEYLKAIEPYMPVLSQAPKLDIGDVASRRAGTDALFDMIMPAWPTMSDVEYTSFTVRTDDGFEVPMHRLV